MTTEKFGYRIVNKNNNIFFDNNILERVEVPAGEYDLFGMFDDAGICHEVFWSAPAKIIDKKTKKKKYVFRQDTYGYIIAGRILLEDKRYKLKDDYRAIINRVTYNGKEYVGHNIVRVNN